MKKLRLALLSLMVCGSSAFAYTTTESPNIAQHTNAGPSTLTNIFVDFDGNPSIPSMTPLPAAASDVTLTIIGSGDTDGNFATSNPFGVFAESLGGTMLGTVDLTNVCYGGTATCTNGEDFSVTIPMALFNAFLGDNVFTVYFTNSESSGVGDWMWLGQAELTYTPVPVPAALPLFLSGLLVLTRGLFRKKQGERAAAA